MKYVYKKVLDYLKDLILKFSNEYERLIVFVFVSVSCPIFICTNAKGGRFKNTFKSLIFLSKLHA